MSSSGWSAGTNYFATAPFTAPSPPYSFALWLWPNTSTSTLSTLFSLGLGPVVNISTGSTSGSSFAAESFYSDVSAKQSFAGALSTNSWNHVCGVFWPSGTTMVSTVCYVNGSAGNVTTGAQNIPSGSIRWFLGMQNFNVNPAVATWLIGGRPTIWTTTLTQTDVTQLQTIYPNQVNVANLKSWYYLTSASTQIDQMGFINMSMIGTMGVSTNEPALTNANTGTVQRAMQLYSMMRNS